MRIIKYMFIGILILGNCSNTISQNRNDLPGDLILAFKQGNSISLSNFFGDRVALSIQDKESSYSKSQAKQIMSKFFNDFPPVNFIRKHTGGKTGARYVTGDLQTKKGKFRVSFLLKEQNGKFIIHQLNIEKD